jgi:hypothetical protein
VLLLAYVQVFDPNMLLLKVFVFDEYGQHIPLYHPQAPVDSVVAP